MIQLAVKEFYPEAVIVRPAPIFATEDKFLVHIANLAKSLDPVAMTKLPPQPTGAVVRPLLSGLLHGVMYSTAYVSRSSCNTLGPCVGIWHKHIAVSCAL